MTKGRCLVLMPFHEPFISRHDIVENWPNTFFKFAQELLDVAPEARPRVFVRHLSFLPTAAVLQIDDLYFFRPYGPPNRGGWASPWLACDTTQASASWADYLKNFVDFAIRDAALHARET